MLLAGEEGEARERLRETAELYRRSWEAAGPRSFGRLIGMIKAAVLAGGGGEEAAYVREALGDEPETPVAAYALAIAALVDGDDSLAGRSADVMRQGSDPLGRAADAVAALADGDRARYAAAIGSGSRRLRGTRGARDRRSDRRHRARARADSRAARDRVRRDLAPSPGLGCAACRPRRTTSGIRPRT